MIANLKNFFSRHALISLYMVVYFGLLFGVYVTSGTKYFGGMFLYGFSFLAFYSIFSLSAVKKITFEKFRIPKFLNFKLSIYWLLIPALAVFVLHIIMLDGIPTYKALSLKYIEDVAKYRHSITFDQPSWILYASSITLKSVFPFLVLYLMYKKSYWLYWLVFIIAVVYSSALLQKSFIIGALVPSMIFCIAERKYLFILKYITVIFLVVISLTYVSNPISGSNPSLDRVEVVEAPTGPGIWKPKAEDSKFKQVVLGLADRLFIVPGQVVTDWFETIPEKAPFLYGDGYRALALLRGRTYHNYPRELYPIMQPEYAAAGLAGSVNVASFMYEFSNFGYPGLILSGLMLAFLLSWVEFFFKEDLTLKFSLCLFPVLVLSSGSITTLLFSGGFGFTILFYFLFIRNKKFA